MLSVFLNGKFLDDVAEAKVSALDAGLQHGVGLFETMLGGAAGDSAWTLHLDEHLERLAASADALALSNDLRAGALGDAVLETVRRSGLARARVRLTVTGGDLNMLARAKTGAGEKAQAGAGHDPTILIVAQPATAYPRAMIEQGVSVTIAGARANPLNPDEGHKTLNYWWRLRELQGAGAKGAAEAIVFSVSNHLCSGCVSNVVLIKDGKFFTPIARGEEQEVARGAERGAAGESPRAVMPSPVLPGVTRRWAMQSCEGQGILGERRMLSISDLLEADEVFLTNSSWGVLPVVRVEAKAIGSGAVGPITRGLAAAWMGEVERLAQLASRGG